MPNARETESTGFGLHLTADLEGCDKDALEDLRLVHDTLAAVCESIGMKALTAPYAFFYDGGQDPRGHGVTGFLVIAESHISIHTFPDMRHVFADVFSCRPFDAQRAAARLKAAFFAQHAELRVVERGRNFVWDAGPRRALAAEGWE